MSLSFSQWVGCPLLTARLPCGTEEFRYRCFLPDLTGFAAPSCTGPNYQQSTSKDHRFNAERVKIEPLRIGRGERQDSNPRPFLKRTTICSWESDVDFRRADPQEPCSPSTAHLSCSIYHRPCDVYNSPRNFSLENGSHIVDSQEKAHRP
jgi:hypothetical protein